MSCHTHFFLLLLLLQILFPDLIHCVWTWRQAAELKFLKPSSSHTFFFSPDFKGHFCSGLTIFKSYKMKWCVCTSQNNKLGCGVHCVWLADNKLRWVRCRTDLPEQNRRLCRAVGDPSQPDDSVIVLQKLITLPFKIRVSFVCRRVPLPGSVIVPVPLFLRCCAALIDTPPPQWPLWDAQI